MIDLKDRLPPAITDSERMGEIFEAIDEYWEQNIAPTQQRLINLRSVFTASEEDLSKMLEELTAYFDDASDELTKPLSIFWKRNEIRNKNSEWAIEALLQRIKIDTKDIGFQRMYAPKDTVTYPYGGTFLTADQITDMGADLNDYFLTSHMTFNINLDDIYGNDWEEDALRFVIERYFEENVRPGHIVFDGVNFYIYHQIIFALTTTTQTNRVTLCKHI